MAFSAILAQVKSILQSVSGIGVVHDYWRHVKDVTEYRGTKFVSSNIFHVWFIRRSETLPAGRGTGNQVFRQHVFDLWGYYQIDDSATSEKTFGTLIDNILLAYDADLDLGGSVDVQDFAPQLVRMDDAEFGGVLCHRAQIQVIGNEDMTP